VTRRRQTRHPAPFCDCAFPVISAALNVRKPAIGDVQFPPARRAARKWAVLYWRDDIYRRWIWSRQPLIDERRTERGSPKSLCALAHGLLVVLRPDWRSPTGTGSAGSYFAQIAMCVGAQIARCTAPRLAVPDGHRFSGQLFETILWNHDSPRRREFRPIVSTMLNVWAIAGQVTSDAAKGRRMRRIHPFMASSRTENAR